MAARLGLPVHCVTELVTVQGVGGQTLPYTGYVEADIQIQDSSQESIPALLLVVEDTAYHKTAPVLLGTNFLQVIHDQRDGSPDADFPPFDRAWRLAMAAVKKHSDLKKRHQPLGQVWCRQAVTVSPGQSVETATYAELTDLGLRSSVIMDDDDVAVPGGLVMMPTLFHVQPDTTKIQQTVRLYNPTGKSVTIPAHAVLADLKLAEVVTTASGSADEDFSEDVISSLMERVPPEVESKDLDILRHILERRKNAWSRHDMDLGHTTMRRHNIRLTSEVPFKERSRRIPPSMVDEVRQHLEEMLELGVIRKSESSYSSGVVLVRKKDGRLRFCIDLRRLNNLTIKDAYALPRIEETLDTLSGAQWFSKLDLRSGYWQVEMAEEDKHKTAFSVGNLGFYECNRMPMGLSNAPATFQRLMEACMGDAHLTACLLFFDDILVFSNTLQTHLERLDLVLGKLEKAGLKVRLDKTELLQRSVKFLGHVVSSEGVETDPDKIRCVQEWPIPRTVKEVQSFIGFAGFYRRFVPGFARVARPLHDVTAGTATGKKGKKPQAKFFWGEAQQTAFDRLKSLLTSAPVLAYANSQKPFILHTDASTESLGAVLLQTQEGKERVIAYASRGLNSAERHYPAHKLEFLALKWAVTDKFHDYLYGNKFVVKTDNNPLTYVLTSAKLDATGHRWIAQLANYNFDLEYRAGRLNLDADALSRISWDQGTSTMTREVVSALLQGKQCDPPLSETVYLAQQTADCEGEGSKVSSGPDWKQEQQKNTHSLSLWGYIYLYIYMCVPRLVGPM